MIETNAALVEQIQRNDPSAFAKLVRRYQPLVFRVCLRILGHQQDAEDATQETFSRIARYLDRWDNRRPLEPWIVAIAGNRCKTLLASQRCFRPLSTILEPCVDSAQQHQAAESLQEEICLALHQLPHNHRLAFELFHEQSLTYAEIAAEMGCPAGTVKTWVHRARLQLIEHLRARDVLDTDGGREHDVR